VTPALHTPLMSVTNAISGIIIIGGMLQIGAGLDAASVLGAVAVLIAAINVSGGFLVTRRMLKMFHKGPG
jgi:NAD(P) transhydrogenase subunit alpha